MDDNNGLVRGNDEDNAENHVTVATKEQKEAKKPLTPQGCSTFPEPATAAKKMRTTKTSPTASKQVHATTTHSLTLTAPWFSDNSNEEDYIDDL